MQPSRPSAMPSSCTDRGGRRRQKIPLSSCSAVIVGTVLFSIAISFFDTHRNISFLLANWKFVLMTGCGFFISFLGFYLLYTGFGASSYILYAVISILTTSIGVGVFCYREPFNLYHTLSLLCALLTIVFFSYGQHISTLK